MDRDGTREGFDLDLTRTIVDAVTVPVIASGGVGSLEHLVEGIVDRRRRRRARRVDLPLPGTHDRRGEGAAHRGGRRRPPRRGSLRRTRCSASRIASARWSSAAVTTEQRDGVLICHIDDGKANALSAEIIAAIIDVLTRAEHDASVIGGRAARSARPVQRRLRPVGDDAATTSPRSPTLVCRRRGARAARCTARSIPVVAACTGHALAAGALVLLGCDRARRRRRRLQDRAERGGDRHGAARLGVHDRRRPAEQAAPAARRGDGAAHRRRRARSTSGISTRSSPADEVLDVAVAAGRRVRRARPAGVRRDDPSPAR